MYDRSGESITIVSKSGLFRNGLRSLLCDSAFSVIDELQSADQIEPRQTGIVLLDAGVDPLEIVGDVHRLSGEQAELPVVVLADVLDWNSLVSVLGAGASGYLLKDISTEALVGSLRLVLLGEKVFPTDMSSLLLRSAAPALTLAAASDRTDLPNLSGRENEILRYLVEGESNKSIARGLDVTEATVKVHMKSLMRKLKCSNRTQAAIWAVNHGVYDLSSADEAGPEGEEPDDTEGMGGRRGASGVPKAPVARPPSDIDRIQRRHGPK